jgi:hypothetical protein
VTTPDQDLGVWAWPTTGGDVEETLRGDRSVIHYHFPVEIEVRSAAATVDVEGVVDRMVTRLVQGLEAS